MAVAFLWPRLVGGYLAFGDHRFLYMLPDLILLVEPT
jgi:hypothetical protein